MTKSDCILIDTATVGYCRIDTNLVAKQYVARFIPFEGSFVWSLEIERNKCIKQHHSSQFLFKESRYECYDRRGKARRCQCH